MKYILMMSGTKADFDWYAKWSKQDLQAHFAFMHAFNKELKDSGAFVAAEGLAFPDQAKIVRAGSDGSPSPMEFSRKPKSFSPDSGSLTWKAPRRRTGSPRGLRRRPPAVPRDRGIAENQPIEVRQVMSGPPEELL